ncbi:hypothetical protein RJ640_017311 [Escallonia rubra]|uniref:Uncharacterized protein n=1 Tax=Escallonia rubra TaxID=112253 RepID=A0AA88R7Y5_9ASTE|nr:hypothetical protein RJ640_017311 [Escallonia rubra]
MVAGKVKMAMGLQKSPVNPKPNPSPKPPPPPPSSGKVPQKGAVFSRSFGVYFPRASAQVQPRPPDVTELLHLVEELRERESLLKTELLEQKLLKESVAILPVLENEIAVRDTEIDRSARKIECLEEENERLRQEVETLHTNLSEQKKDNELRVTALESKISKLKKLLTEREHEELSSSQRFQGLVDVSVKSSLIKNLKKSATLASLSSCSDAVHGRFEAQSGKEKDVLMEVERPRHARSNSEEIAESSESLINIRSRIPRVPKPPPRPLLTGYAEGAVAEPAAVVPQPPPAQAPPPPPPMPRKAATAPPPPPPPPRGAKAGAAKVRRVPEVVEFYHSLMRRDSRREGGCGGGSELLASANARDMIGEIENRSTHLLAVSISKYGHGFPFIYGDATVVMLIKTDVETQGDFIRFLIKEVEDAAFTDIQDVVPFVKWLDDELSYLVDERAVLKHFQWPEQKADTLREAAFGYCDLKKLESEATSFRDDPRQPCAPALKKMQALFEKLEHGVYNLSRMRESASKRYKVFRIPMDWMLDTGYVSQIKLASVKLALKYMRRVSAELETVDGGPEEEELIVQGVRFAFRVHQFASGFDVETMRAFQELRDKARACHVQCQNQQQQKLVCRSTAC